jgi:hypothetical protein
VATVDLRRGAASMLHREELQRGDGRQHGFVVRRVLGVGRCLQKLHLHGANESEATSRTCFIRLIPRMPFLDSASENFW